MHARVVCLALIAACEFRGGAAGGQLDARIGGGSDARAGTGSDSRVVDASQPGAWTCGAQPSPLPVSVSDTPSGASLTMTSIALTGGEAGGFASGQLVVATAGASLALSFDFTLTDTRCPSDCIDQIEVGWMQGSNGPRYGCAYDNGVPKSGGVDDSVSDFAITAPTTPGAYELRTDIGQNFSCGNQSTWWDDPPPGSSSTIAILCVQ